MERVYYTGSLEKNKIQSQGVVTLPWPLKTDFAINTLILCVRVSDLWITEMEPEKNRSVEKRYEVR